MERIEERLELRRILRLPDVGEGVPFDWLRLPVYTVPGLHHSNHRPSLRQNHGNWSDRLGTYPRGLSMHHERHLWHHPNQRPLPERLKFQVKPDVRRLLSRVDLLLQCDLVLQLQVLRNSRRHREPPLGRPENLIDD